MQKAFVAAAVLAASAAFAARTLEGFAGLPLVMWNSIRVAPPVALAKGFDLYYGADAGPILNTPYGPVWGLLYTPAALAESPTPALWIALLISLLVFFVPIAWLLKRMAGSTGAVLLGLAAFTAMMPAQLERSLFTHHADPPALGFGACAIACLTYRRGSWGAQALVAAAFFVLLAAWAKQTIAPLALGVLLYIWLADGRRAALRFGSILAAVGLAVSVAFVLAFGEPMLFNMFELQASHPWHQPLGRMFIDAALNLLGLLSASAVVIVGAVYIGWRPLGLREFAREHEWLALVVVSVLLSPSAIMGALHLGGSANAFSVSTFFMLVTAAVCLAGGADGSEPGARRMRTVLASSLVLLLALLELAKPGKTAMVETSLATLNAWRASPLERATDYARANPGTIYFADNPLIALFAEGALHHSEPGIYERELGGVVVAPGHRQAHLPPQMRYVARLGRWHRLPPIHESLPAYRRQLALPELPGWRVWTREAP